MRRGQATGLDRIARGSSPTGVPRALRRLEIPCLSCTRALRTLDREFVRVGAAAHRVFAGRGYVGLVRLGLVAVLRLDRHLVRGVAVRAVFDLSRDRDCPLRRVGCCRARPRESAAGCQGSTAAMAMMVARLRMILQAFLSSPRMAANECEGTAVRYLPLPDLWPSVRGARGTPTHGVRVGPPREFRIPAGLCRVDEAALDGEPGEVGPASCAGLLAASGRDANGRCSC